MQQAHAIANDSGLADDQASGVVEHDAFAKAGSRMNVDGEDFGILLSGWGPCGGACEDVCDGDINLDCQINGTDLGLLFIDWTG